MTDVYWYWICRANCVDAMMLASIVGAAISRCTGDRIASPASGRTEVAIEADPVRLDGVADEPVGVPQDRLDDAADAPAVVGEEPAHEERRLAVVEVRDDHLRGDEVPDEPEGNGRRHGHPHVRAPGVAAPGGDEDDDAHHRHGEGGVLAHDQDHGDSDPVPAAPPAEEEVPGEQERRDHQRLGVEVDPGDPLRRCVEQVGGGEEQTDQRCAEPVLGDQVDGQRTEGDRDVLHDVEELRPGPEPVERGERVGDEVDVMAPHVETADRHERAPPRDTSQNAWS